MSDAPRTDALYADRGKDLNAYRDTVDFARVLERELADMTKKYETVGRMHTQICDIAAERCATIARLRDMLSKWSHDSALQTFEDRERFRKEARAALALVQS